MHAQERWLPNKQNFRNQHARFFAAPRGGFSIKVAAEVCWHCGERLYAEDVVRTFEEMRGKLKKQDFSYLRSLGQSFTVEENWPNKEPPADRLTRRFGLSGGADG